MDIEEDTFEWLGMPTPLEMYKQHVSLLEDEILDLNLQLRKARENIRGLVKMHDGLAAEKARTDADLQKAMTSISDLNRTTSMLDGKIKSLLMVYDQNIRIHHQNQELLRQLRQFQTGTTS